MSKTIQDVINLIMETVLEAQVDDTVDTVKCGDSTQEVTGIVTTFTASLDILRQAVTLGANFVITHEPTFYDHRDHTAWLADDPVYQTKRAFIEQHNLTIWRFHDYWHRHQPDGINTGMIKALGWEAFSQPGREAIMIIPGLTVAALVTMLKEKLGLTALRVVGDPKQTCERVALLVGASGGEHHIKVFRQWGDADVVICGETNEWQTCEYVRDAIAMGHNKSLVIIGHANSEQEGMHYLAEWLQPKVAAIPVTYLAVGDPLVTL